VSSDEEPFRLRALRAYQILDTPAEPIYDDLTQLAAHVCETPMAVITLIDEYRQWFKSEIGMPSKESSRSVAFCAHTIEHDDVFIVEDAVRDPRFANNPFVVGEPGIRFYAGAPLVSWLGPRIGALAVIDSVPRTLSDEQVQLLRSLARQVMSQLELRRERLEHQLTIERLWEAQRIAHIGSWELNITENALLWSRQVYEIFGVTAGEFGGDFEAFFAYVHPDDQPAMMAAYQQALRGEAPLDIRHRITRPDGEVRYVRERAQLVERQGLLLVGTVQDVTSEYEAEFSRRLQQAELSAHASELERLNDQLRASEERFRLVALVTVDTIWDWDLTTNAVWWNSGLQTQFGYAPEEIEDDAQSWTTRIHPDDVERVLESIHNVIDGSTNEWEATYRLRRRDGTYAEVADRGFVIRDAQGNGVRMVGGMTDITERLALEEQLRQAQRLEAVGQLTGGVAHDFNNLLTVIMGNAELIVEELADHDQLRPLAEMIGSAAQHGAELTQRLLAFARRQALDPRPVNVNALAAGMNNLLRRTLGEHIEIEIDYAADPWHALVDPAQLESALLNLCLNARDAMPHGGRLTIETANVRIDAEYAEQQVEVLPGQYIMLAVSDTGTGIAQEHLARIFEPFFTTKKKGEGTGLGLSMVYGFVKQSSGHVNITSAPGKGTTVRLFLPRAQSEASQPGAAVERYRNEASAQGTILLVEDDELVRQYARQSLAGMGYTVLAAATGAEALAILRERDDIVLLFTDIVMPGGMSGRELVDVAQRERPGLKVLYTSGYTDNAIVHHGRLDPGVHLLTKPYRRADLARKIRELLMEESD
jgi:PAS domain S-box-containing protein